eukprot:15573934-Heterocapsa_arctica.AAC.1
MEAQQRMLMDKADDGDLDDLMDDPDLPEDADPGDIDEDPLDAARMAAEEAEDLFGPESDADGNVTPEVLPEDALLELEDAEPPPRRQRKEPDFFTDATAIEFEQVNPKRVGTRSHEQYEMYKPARTVGEAILFGANRRDVRYDIKKGYAKLTAAPAVLLFALAATKSPLVEGWCSPTSSLGEVGEALGRRVIRLTEADDMSDEKTVKFAMKEAKENPGCHLHGSLPCTPWTSWQRLNLRKATEAKKASLMQSRILSMEFVVTFTRLAKSVLAKGGSVSFEWPRGCDGWKQPAVKKMVAELKLTFVSIDGCAVGVQSEGGERILKPWRFA